MPSISEQIISLCQNPNTALQAIHLLIANNGASESAFRAVYDRVMVDNDVDGAYYLANFASGKKSKPCLVYAYLAQKPYLVMLAFWRYICLPVNFYYNT